MDSEYENSFKLIAPFTMIVAGQTLSGKTQLVKRILENMHEIIKNPPNRIIISYTENQDAYTEIKTKLQNVHLVRGLDFELTDFDQSEPSLLLIDDQMNDLVKSPKLQELFTKGVHHRSVSVIIIQQNLFPQGKHGRDIRLNSHYIAVMKSATFPLQVSCLGKSLFPQKPSFLTTAYKKATTKPYSHLFINLHPLCDDRYRITEGLTDSDNIIVYLPE